MGLFFISKRISMKMAYKLSLSFEKKEKIIKLKELYTSISTLAQKLALTLLKNELILKNRNSTPLGRKIRKHFRPKIHKSRISA